MNKLAKAEALADLGQFTGTERHHAWSFLFRKHVLTDGAKYVADKAGAYWLMDAIASYHARCVKDVMLQDFQLWQLKVTDGKGVLTCRRDSNERPAIRQVIEYTDFPNGEITLYCNRCDEAKWCIMLRSEY